MNASSFQDFPAFSSAIFSFIERERVNNQLRMLMQVKKRALNTFIINPLVHIYQKEKIALKSQQKSLV